MNPARIYRLIIPILLLVLFSCEWDPNKPDLPEEILVLNHWIWDGMNDAYLWEEFLPNLDPDYQEDPEQYFYNLLYSGDRDSWIVNNYQELAAMFDGVELATGMSARPGYAPDSTLISIVEYVTPDSPAEKALVKRGDIIISINGTKLTSTNYYALYYLNTATFEFGDWNGSEMVPNGNSVTLTAIELNKNPVIHSEVIDYKGNKIGFLVYTQFTEGPEGEWETELNRVFDEFKTAGVSDVIMDLRYNRGGRLELSAYIASTLGPHSIGENQDVFLELVWNDSYNAYWKEADLDHDGEPDGENSSQLVFKFSESDLNLDLQKVYFLTTSSTASASESLMTGLYPYMEVVQIGTTTYGKCYGSWTIDDWANPKRHNWAMQPIVVKYSNALGFTDFVDGISPDFLVKETLFFAPFGSFEDPLLAKALEEITGIAPAKKSTAEPAQGFRSLPEQRKSLVELEIDWPGRSEPVILH